MTKWEYFKSFGREDQDALDELGDEGWELVCYSEGVQVFKRPVVDPPLENK